MLLAIFENCAFGDMRAVINRQIALAMVPLDAKQEQVFIKRYKRYGDRDALDALLMTCVKFMHGEARKREGFDGMRYEDLIQEGVVGFMKALKNYNESLTNPPRLYSYAEKYISCEMNDYSIRNARGARPATTKVNRKIFFNFFKILNAKNIELEKISEENIRDIANELEVPKESVSEMAERLIAHDWRSLSGFSNLGQHYSFEDYIYEESKAQKLLEALDSLSDRERYIFKACYPLDGRRAKKLEELAEDQGDVTKQAIDQVKQRAIKKIKQYLRDVGCAGEVVPDSDPNHIHSLHVD